MVLPGCQDVEIGINLRESIPVQHCHLIQHLDTSDHKRTIKILEQEIGTKDVMIVDIISQVEKLKMKMLMLSRTLRPKMKEYWLEP